MAVDPKYIVVDGIVYNIPIIELDREAAILDLEANRTQDGVLHRNVIGTFYNYTLKIGQVRDTALYERLWWHLTAPKASHVVKLPHDGVEFEGYFSSCKDNIYFVTVDANGHRYKAKGFTCKLTAMRPARTPDEEDDSEDEST